MFKGFAEEEPMGEEATVAIPIARQPNVTGALKVSEETR